MYQVILVQDEKKGKAYYYSYVKSADTTLGNIEVDDLPAYQDINKARACTYEDGSWIFDEAKYADILDQIELEEEAAEEEKAKEEAKLSNEEIADALMELAELFASIDERLSALE